MPSPTIYNESVAALNRIILDQLEFVACKVGQYVPSMTLTFWTDGWTVNRLNGQADMSHMILCRDTSALSKGH